MSDSSTIDTRATVALCHTTWYLACPGHNGLVAWLLLQWIANVATPCNVQSVDNATRANCR